MGLRTGNLINQMPTRESSIGSDQQALSTIQAAQAISKNVPQGLQPQAIKEAGSQIEKQAGEAVVKEEAGLAEKRLKQQDVALQRDSLAKQQELANRELAISQESRGLQDRLFSLEENTAKEMLDNSVKFQQDELGRTEWSTRQLADWAVTKAESQEELNNYEAMATQVFERKAQIMAQAYAKLEQEMLQSFEQLQKDKDYANKLEINEASKQLQLNIARREEKLQKKYRQLEFAQRIKFAKEAISRFESQNEQVRNMEGWWNNQELQGLKDSGAKYAELEAEGEAWRAQRNQLTQEDITEYKDFQDKIIADAKEDGANDSFWAIVTTGVAMAAGIGTAIAVGAGTGGAGALVGLKAGTAVYTGVKALGDTGRAVSKIK